MLFASPPPSGASPGAHGDDAAAAAASQVVHAWWTVTSSAGYQCHNRCQKDVCACDGTGGGVGDEVSCWALDYGGSP